MTVESSGERIIPDSEYARAGCRIVPAGAWHEAHKSVFILGIKELSDDGTPLDHRHIYFAHAYKGQSGSDRLLSRFIRGGGRLLDLEYLIDDQGRRVAAFGHWAGFAGAALGVAAWCAQRKTEAHDGVLGSVSCFKDESQLIQHLDEQLKLSAKGPTSLVIGAKGRCGRGALKALRALGLSPAAWDLDETRGGGPFEEILEYDLLVNCILLQGRTAPFLTPEMLSDRRKLSVISDVSCDPTSSYHPLPVYGQTTSFSAPVQRLKKNPVPLDVIAIDHLPSLLPRESSQDFSNQLLPHLRELCSSSSLPPVWARCERIFLEKTTTLAS